MAVGKAVPVHA